MESDQYFSVYLCAKDLELIPMVSQFFTYVTFIIRSGGSQMFFNIGILENFSIFTGKHMCWSLFLISCRPIKKRCFPVNSFFQKTPLVAASVLYVTFFLLCNRLFWAKPFQLDLRRKCYRSSQLMLIFFSLKQFKGKVQFVQNVTFEPLIGFKQNHYWQQLKRLQKLLLLRVFFP